MVAKTTPAERKERRKTRSTRKITAAAARAR